MARTASTPLKNAKQRSKLAIRIAPYFDSIVPGRVLGYIRKGPSEAGAWIVRVETGRTSTGPVRRRKLLGAADDLAVANGADILSFDQAFAAASDWNASEEEKKANGCTLAKAVEQHRNFAGKWGDKTERAKLAAFHSLQWNLLGLTRQGEVRDDVTIVSSLKNGETPKGPWALDGDLLVNDLTTELLTALRSSWLLTGAKANSSRATALRKWTDVHSCLEQAFGKPSNNIPSPKAWQDVKALNQEFEPRTLHFTDEEAVAIIEHVRASDTYVADYLEGLYRCGSRPGGELFALRVRHFVPGSRKIVIQGRSETVKAKNGGRDVGLSPSALAFFTRLTAGRSGSEPLFTTDGVNGWTNDSSRRVKALLVAAVRHVLGDAAFTGPDALTDNDIVPYAFRHTFISRRAAKGMPAAVIGKVCGTSEYMIQKTYSKQFPSEAHQWLVDTDVKTSLRVAA